MIPQHCGGAQHQRVGKLFPPHVTAIRGNTVGFKNIEITMALDKTQTLYLLETGGFYSQRF